MNPRDLPDGVITLEVIVDGNPTSLAGLRDIASDILRERLPDCWMIEHDDDATVHVRHPANACPRGCLMDDGSGPVNGDQHYTLADLLRMILLSRLGVRAATYDEERATIPDGNLSA